MSHGLRSVKQGLSEHYEWATDPRPRVGFGMPFFDGPTNGGLAREECGIIMACSSVGKTAVGLNVIRHNPDVPAVFFSLEMSWRMLSARLVAMHTGMTTRQLETSVRTYDVIPPQAIQTSADFPLFLCDDTPASTLVMMDRALEQAGALMGQRPRLVVIDYLELIPGAGGTNGTEQVDKIARKIRDWTRKNDVSTWCLHQVGKGDGGAGADPLELTSGRYGGHTPFDYVVGAYAPRLRKGITPDEFHRVKDELYLQLLKNRNGEAMPAGQRHRLDSSTLRLSEWQEPTWQLPGFQPEPDPLWLDRIHPDLLPDRREVEDDD